MFCFEPQESISQRTRRGGRSAVERQCRAYFPKLVATKMLKPRCRSRFVRNVTLIQNKYADFARHQLRENGIPTRNGYARITYLNDRIDKPQIFSNHLASLLHMTRIPIKRLHY
jgi:hypothetical protein